MLDPVTFDIARLVVVMVILIAMIPIVVGLLIASIVMFTRMGTYK